MTKSLNIKKIIMELKDFKERFVFIKYGNAKFYKKVDLFLGSF